MKIAWVHYHLKTGGVTTVLKRQIAALNGTCDMLVLTGDRAAAQLPCTIVEIAGLGYDQPGVTPPSPDRVADGVIRALTRKWPDGCDVLHIHNPTLAKNRQFMQIIQRLQQADIDLFLQIHDFAEDGRPETYFEEDYPVNCHYGAINRRDVTALASAGLKRSGLHYIPNALPGFSVNGHPRLKPQVLYPVRAIRRKNLGEALLLSLFFKRGRRLVLTQPPNSPGDVASYRDWVTWVRKKRLPIDFGAGNKNNFSAIVAASESVITTSVSEGFGFVFLEPWTAGKLLWGRRLPEICSDYEALGLRFDWLYDRLDVPLDWIRIDDFGRSWCEAVFDAGSRYGHERSTGSIARAFARLTRDDTVDFGLLHETFQRQVLDRLSADPSTKAELARLNPWLSNPGAVPDAATMIETNRQSVLRHYDLDRYRQRLLAIYDRVVGHAVRHRIDKRKLLDAFFNLDRFSLLKWGTYDL